jgi:hypothetical protein
MMSDVMKQPVATKTEVIAKLTEMLRRRDDTISDESFVKLMTAMCKLQGWL